MRRIGVFILVLGVVPLFGENTVDPHGQQNDRVSKYREEHRSCNFENLHQDSLAESILVQVVQDEVEKN